MVGIYVIINGNKDKASYTVQTEQYEHEEIECAQFFGMFAFHAVEGVVCSLADTFDSIWIEPAINPLGEEVYEIWAYNENPDDNREVYVEHTDKWTPYTEWKPLQEAVRDAMSELLK